MAILRRKDSNDIYIHHSCNINSELSLVENESDY